MVTASHIDATKIITAVWAPGAVAADLAFDLPSYYPEIDSILGAYTFKLAEAAPNTWASQAIAPIAYAATIADNKITKVDGNSIRVGHALDASDLLVVTYRAT